MIKKVLDEIEVFVAVHLGKITAIIIALILIITAALQ